MLEDRSSDFSRAKALNIINRKLQGISRVSDVIYNKHFIPANVNRKRKANSRFCFHFRTLHIVFNLYCCKCVKKQEIRNQPAWNIASPSYSNYQIGLVA
ncbi:hypothetical protein SDC9_164875 [bioreactor metagenome]|uniref:Uncharacterized protein n=1 Tax=bioreactor metagenome TaxID=1076179 RepID=A0A645FSU4_9ZZZZ